MKIALLHYSAPPVVGGVESVLAQHARLMALAGHAVTILAGRGAAFEEAIPVHVLPRLDSRYVEVLQIKARLDQGECPPAFAVLKEQIKVELAAELKSFDLLIAHNVASLHKNLALTAALYELYRSPGASHLILWHHDLAWMTPRYRHELYDGYPWDLLRSPWEGATHVVVSGLRRQELSRLSGVPEAAIRVIPNGVNLETFFKLEPQTVQFVERLKLDKADPLLLLPARLTPRKNVELALHTLAELRRTFPNAMLLVTGPEVPHNPANRAYKQSLLALRDELGLKEAAVFLAEQSSEFMPDAVIADFYRLADALIFPSREEGFGIPLIEAAFSSKPVFCADIPVLRELGGDDVDTFDPDADPSYIAGLIENRLQSEATLRWARRAKKGYAWASIYQRYIEPLIREVTA